MAKTTEELLWEANLLLDDLRPYVAFLFREVIDRLAKDEERVKALESLISGLSEYHRPIVNNRSEVDALPNGTILHSHSGVACNTILGWVTSGAMFPLDSSDVADAIGAYPLVVLWRPLELEAGTTEVGKD